MEMRNRLLILAIFGTLAAMLAGCAHHAGYAEVMVKYQPTPDAQVRVRTEGPFLEVSKSPTVTDPTVAVKLYNERITEREAALEYSGLAMRAPYHWTVPIIKPVLPVSLVLAVWMPARAPHDHNHNAWHMGDYLRDLVGWLNPFEGLPSGARELHGDRVVFRRKNGYETLESLLSPIGPTIVHVFIGKEQVAYITINANGEGMLNLRQALNVYPVEKRTVLLLKGGGAESRIVLNPADNAATE